jgi:hypothetical protein
LIPENHIETAPFLKEILSNIQVGRGLAPAAPVANRGRSQVIELGRFLKINAVPFAMLRGGSKPPPYQIWR